MMLEMIGDLMAFALGSGGWRKRRRRCKVLTFQVGSNDVLPKSCHAGSLTVARRLYALMPQARYIKLPKLRPNPLT